MAPRARGRGATYPLTAGQRWLLHLLEQAPDLARPVQRIYRLHRPLDTVALLAALRRVVEAQPALRMRLVETAHGIAQRFPALEADISGLRIEGRDADTRRRFAAQVLARETGRTLDLRREPPFLLKVVEWDGESWLSVCLDHLAADDWAADVFERELEQAYRREARGDPPPAGDAAPALYACLAREAAQRDREPANLAYWRDHLAGAPLGPCGEEWPPAVPAETLRFALSAEALRELAAACRSRQCSPFHAVVAALVTLLCGLGHTDDLVLNIPVSGRTQASDHAVILNLSMLLHVRFRKLAGEPAGQWLRRVRNQTLEAMAHRQVDYPALGAAVAAEAAARGGRAHFLRGISYLVERPSAGDESPLFAERIDELPGTAAEIPRTGFTVACREGAAGLRLTVDWDPAAWAVSGPELERRFRETLGATVDLRLPSP